MRSFIYFIMSMLLLIGGTTAVQAQSPNTNDIPEWFEWDSGDDFEMFIRTADLLNKQTQNPRVWVRVDWKKFGNNKRTMMLEEIDCRSQQHRAISKAYYFHSGDSEFDNTPEEWAFIIPGSRFEELYELACSTSN